MAASTYRLQAIRLYKDLHRIGRDYPDPSYDFLGKLRKGFERNRHLEKAEDIEKALALGEFIKKETLALYSLKKYRFLRRSYHPDDAPR